MVTLFVSQAESGHTERHQAQDPGEARRGRVRRPRGSSQVSDTPAKKVPSPINEHVPYEVIKALIKPSEICGDSVI